MGEISKPVNTDIVISLGTKLTEPDDNFDPVTEGMINSYPNFTYSLAKRIFILLDSNSLENADYVIGRSGEMLPLMYFVTRLINEHRQKFAIKKSCTTLSWALIDCRYISLGQMLLDFLMYIIGRKKKIIFVHCLFDHPSKHYNNAPWKDSEEALKHWVASEATQDKKVIEELAESMSVSGILCQSVILPVPRKEYAEFLVQ